MQQLDFRCPRCSAIIKAPVSLEGETSDCPKCNAEIERWPAPLNRPAPKRQPPQVQSAAQPNVWFYMVGDKQRGPISEAQLKALAESGTLRPTDLVWREGMPQWVAAAWLPGLFPQQPAAQPPAVLPQAQVAILPPERPAEVGYAPERETKECPFCSEVVSIRAKRCPVCGETIDVAMRAAEEAQRRAEEARDEAREARREARKPQRVIHHHRPQCPHALHLLLTIFTLGVWLPIWIIHAIVVEAS